MSHVAAGSSLVTAALGVRGLGFTLLGKWFRVLFARTAGWDLVF